MIKRIKSNPSLKGNASLVPDIVFSDLNEELKMQLLVPWAVEDGIKKDYPAIVFLQGSGWTFPGVHYELPQLSQFAREGYVVATITHRSYLDSHPMPAFLEDTKTAIRFLRANADDLGIDPTRIGFWGTSSGGNTAQLVSLTGDDEKYQTEEWAEESDGVSCAVSCFGPTNLVELYNHFQAESEDSELDFELMIGGSFEENQELVHDMSPLSVIPNRQTECPLLLLHGTADKLVPYEQTIQMYEALQSEEIESDVILVEEADHEGDFWSDEVYQEILAFFNKHLK